MDVVDFFVMVELSVYKTMMCVMDTKNAPMDLMKQIVVRELVPIVKGHHCTN